MYDAAQIASIQLNGNCPPCQCHLRKRLIWDQPFLRANWQEHQDVMYHGIDLNELFLSFRHFSHVEGLQMIDIMLVQKKPHPVFTWISFSGNVVV